MGFEVGIHLFLRRTLRRHRQRLEVPLPGLNLTMTHLLAANSKKLDNLLHKQHFYI